MTGVTASATTTRRRFFAPEVIQTSAMDCGPASLKCLLEGFGISASYGRLREACQTDVDGTSIDVMEETAVQLGLHAKQLMVPPDHLTLPEAGALPALAVVRRSGGENHFVVVWRRLGRVVQVMDPAGGRRWMSWRRLLDELYVHTMPVPAQAWRRWATSDDMIVPLTVRMKALGMRAKDAGQLVETCKQHESWRTIASLDAAARMIETIVTAGGQRRGAPAARMLEVFFHRAIENPDRADQVIPVNYWLARAASGTTEGEEFVSASGAVIVRVTGRRPKPVDESSDDTGRAPPPAQSLSPELAAALEEPPARPGLALLHMLREDGILVPAVLVICLLLAAGGVIVEALLARGIIEVGESLGLGIQRAGALGVVLLFLIGLCGLELAIASGLLRTGRLLETRLRLAFLKKIPRLTDRYFQSRPISDMASRCHSVQMLRLLPNLGGQFIRSCFALVCTTLGIIWLDPGAMWAAVATALVSVVLPLAVQPLLAERDLRLRTHSGALSRFYLDAMIGLIPVRAHGAETPVRREHEGILTHWMRTGFAMQRVVMFGEGCTALAGFLLAAMIVFGHLGRAGDTASVLLLVYWALALPAMGQAIALSVRQYPAQRSITMRLTEPLGALEREGEVETEAKGPDNVGPRKHEEATPISLEMKGVGVRIAGRTILTDIDLKIEAGSHVAIVGPSGAGKSTLVGLLLGWHRSSAGTLLVDDLPLTSDRIPALRRRTVWVDPAVQIWNTSFIRNIQYGSEDGAGRPFGQVLQEADLHELLERFPDGLQTRLGESGGLISGGEGQRVRLARGMFRADTGLVILDEPFRGLDREKRLALLQRARHCWSVVTMLCITHDVGDAAEFDRVIVVEAGHVVEADGPKRLLERKDSRYRRMVDAESALRTGTWSGLTWRNLMMQNGRLTERSGEEHHDARTD